MKITLPKSYRIHPEVSYALTHGKPVVALESAVVTHGFSHPMNLELAKSMETIIRDHEVTPSTIALIDGRITVGLTDDELVRLAEDSNAIKVSLRNMGIGLTRGSCGGTTVAATLLAARTAGIQVFVTGGIGGVHRGNPFDISADLNELAESPMVVICAGAKAILDLPATLESLETRGVPVLGYQTDEFPAFYSRTSGLLVDYRIETAREAYDIATAHWNAGNRSAVLVCNPIPADQALDGEKIETVIHSAIQAADRKGIFGAALTPFLLEQVNKATVGEAQRANLALLKNNALLAAEIAGYFTSSNLVAF